MRNLTRSLIVLLGLVGTGVLAGLVWTLGPSLPQWLRTSVLCGSGTLALLTLFTVFFFRDPTPRIPTGDDLVVAPGEGRVIQITQVEEPEFLEGPATRISIFLSVFNLKLPQHGYNPLTKTFRRS